MRLIDADGIVLDYSGLVYIDPTDCRAIAEYFARQIKAMPTIIPKRKRGRWLEKKVVHAINDGCITEWQSCKCSECGRYDTRPYMYYFDEPNFCSYCGAEMQEEES